MSTRVKVSVDKLRERIQEQRAAEQVSYEARLTEYEKEVSAFQEAARKSLEAALEKANKGNFPKSDERYSGGTYKKVLLVPVTKTLPKKPTKASVDHDKALRTLDLLAEDTVVITTTSPFQKYI